MPSDHTTSPKFARPSRSPHWLTVSLSILALIFIALGAASVFFFQKPLTEEQDIRQRAAVTEGKVLVTPALVSGDTFSSNAPVKIELRVNTQNVQVDGVQLVFNVVSSADDLLIEVPTSSGLQAFHQEVEKTSDGHLISLAVISKNIGKSFATTTPVTFATITLKPKQAGAVTLSFDQANSLATVANSTPPKDELRTLAQASYNVTMSTSATPTPTPTPTVTPAVTPTPGVTPSPTPTATPGVGGLTYKQCNQACGSSAECDVNLRCYNGTCRLAKNVSSNTCSSGSNQGPSYQCNQYCADTSECTTGLTCFYNRCRRPDNPDNTACVVASSATQQGITAGCNQPCTDSKQCGVNLRCYTGACRLATNPSSLTCAPTTVATVSTIYSTKGQKGEEIPYPSVSVYPSSSPVASPLTYDESPVDYDGSAVSGNGLLAKAVRLFQDLFAGNAAGVVIGLGVILLLLAALIAMASRGEKSPPARSTAATKPSAAPAPTPSEQTLEQRIAELRNKQGGSLPSPSVVGPVTTTAGMTTPVPSQANPSTMMTKLRQRPQFSAIQVSSQPEAKPTATPTAQAPSKPTP